MSVDSTVKQLLSRIHACTECARHLTPVSVAAGESRDEIYDLIREAMEFHLEGMREDGEEIPTPQCEADYIEITA